METPENVKTVTIQPIADEYLQNIDPVTFCEEVRENWDNNPAAGDPIGSDFTLGLSVIAHLGLYKKMRDAAGNYYERFIPFAVEFFKEEAAFIVQCIAIVNLRVVMQFQNILHGVPKNVREKMANKLLQAVITNQPPSAVVHDLVTDVGITRQRALFVHSGNVSPSEAKIWNRVRSEFIKATQVTSN